MRYFSFAPPPVLAPYVDRFWGIEAERDERVALPVLLPGTGAEIVFHHGRPFAGCDAAHVLCVRSTPRQLGDVVGVGFIAARLRVGALRALTAASPAQLMDNVPRPRDLWGGAAAALEAAVRGARDVQERTALIAPFLVQCLERMPPRADLVHAAGQLYACSDSLRIETLAASMGWSRRHLERRFIEQLGQSPVTLRRAARFHKTLRALLFDPALSITQAALAQGYFDQAHFHRDCRALAGCAPQALLRQARARTHFYKTPRKHCATLPLI